MVVFSFSIAVNNMTSLTVMDNMSLWHENVIS